MNNLPASNQSEPKNEIVVYQPDETVRLDVRLEENTVWLTQNQMTVKVMYDGHDVINVDGGGYEPKGDIVDLMDKLYKEDVVKMIWRLPGNYDIKKREVGNDRYELNVSFSANQDVEYTDAAKNGSNKYKINATVNPDGKISLFKMIKIVE